MSRFVRSRRCFGVIAGSPASLRARSAREVPLWKDVIGKANIKDRHLRLHSNHASKTGLNRISLADDFQVVRGLLHRASDAYKWYLGIAVKQSEVEFLLARSFRLLDSVCVGSSLKAKLA